MPGIEPGAFHMQSERSTTEPHPLLCIKTVSTYIYLQLIHHQSNRPRINLVTIFFNQRPLT